MEFLKGNEYFRFFKFETLNSGCRNANVIWSVFFFFSTLALDICIRRYVSINIHVAVLIQRGKL